ncbi:putative expansin-b2 [Phtheirospermum japonicum]|uniref:Putative expansin-b2 n=1 Tax=Phtheirospermum japonicum TaxID=374723 RepID=A0A830B0E7_9LAMI|nr:putative expansin-b2 [Phtheirospermum japonicum]
MAYLLFTYLAFFSLISNFCHSFNPKLLNVSKYDQYSSNWPTTDATWYGDAFGSGSAGGSCGYEDAVASAPFSSKITAVASSLYNNGYGCGKCFQVKCTSSPYCSGTPVTVVVTDSCLGCDHFFDLSGTSFGAMANPGQDEQLRNAGRLQIQYQSVECDYIGVNVAFRVDPGSNANYFATAIEYEDGDGLVGVALRQANSDGEWMQMQLSWGAVYAVNLPNGYAPPFSFKLTDSSKTVVAENVIPSNYQVQTYRSVVNFGV